jgi:hypothetical protein
MSARAKTTRPGAISRPSVQRRGVLSGCSTFHRARERYDAAAMTSENKPGADRALSPPKLTRNQVARRLGVHITTVRRLERAKKLRPQKNEHGTWLFDAQEVEQLAAARTSAATSGAVAARVFQALRDGFSLQDIVIAFQLPPRVVRELYAEWQAMERPRGGDAAAPRRDGGAQ